jgi:hypothetical protein
MISYRIRLKKPPAGFEVVRPQGKLWKEELFEVDGERGE